MRYNVWMINDAIKKGGELIWGDEKFSPFLEFPIQISLMPAPYNRPIALNSNDRYERVKIIVGEPSNPNPDVLLYKNDVEYDRLSVIGGNPKYFKDFQDAVRRQLSMGLVEEVRNTIPDGSLVENGEIKESSYEGIVEKIRGVTYPLVKRLIGYGVIEEVYEVRIRDREMMIENRKYIYHRVKMTPVFKVPREINNKAYKIIDDTDVSLTIVYKINYVVNIDAQYHSTDGKVKITVIGNPALELKRIGYGE
jgi:hypothetical protein